MQGFSGELGVDEEDGQGSKGLILLMSNNYFYLARVLCARCLLVVVGENVNVNVNVMFCFMTSGGMELAVLAIPNVGKYSFI